MSCRKFGDGKYLKQTFTELKSENTQKLPKLYKIKDKPRRTKEKSARVITSWIAGMAAMARKNMNLEWIIKSIGHN